jgi:hypothetical protein
MEKKNDKGEQSLCKKKNPDAHPLFALPEGKRREGFLACAPHHTTAPPSPSFASMTQVLLPRSQDRTAPASPAPQGKDATKSKIFRFAGSWYLFQCMSLGSAVGEKNVCRDGKISEGDSHLLLLLLSAQSIFTGRPASDDAQVVLEPLGIIG